MKTTTLKNTFYLLLILVGATAGKALAQNDEITLTQSIWGMEKRQIVTDYMKLTGAESAGFWKEYDVYEAARKTLGQERIMLINDYANNYNNMTDAKATELVKKVSANNIAMEKLQLKTFEKMSKVIAPVRAAQFIQLENYLINSIRITLQDSLPFIGELDKTKKK